jgi:hypothetical protein
MIATLSFYIPTCHVYVKHNIYMTEAQQNDPYTQLILNILLYQQVYDSSVSTDMYNQCLPQTIVHPLMPPMLLEL